MFLFLIGFISSFTIIHFFIIPLVEYNRGFSNNLEIFLPNTSSSVSFYIISIMITITHMSMFFVVIGIDTFPILLLSRFELYSNFLVANFDNSFHLSKKPSLSWADYNLAHSHDDEEEIKLHSFVIYERELEMASLGTNYISLLKYNVKHHQKLITFVDIMNTIFGSSLLSQLSLSSCMICLLLIQVTTVNILSCFYKVIFLSFSFITYFNYSCLVLECRYSCAIYKVSNVLQFEFISFVLTLQYWK